MVTLQCMDSLQHLSGLSASPGIAPAGFLLSSTAQFMMKITLKRHAKMSLLDITKIFAMLQPSEEEDGDEERQELNLVVSQDNYQLLDELLCQERYKRFINARSGWGVPGTPLRLAASMGHVRCLEVLLAHGADVDSLDVKAQTPLFTAVSNGHLDCVRALLEAGANPSGSIYNNCTPLLTAARDGDVDILQELLHHGAEANVKARMPEWAANGAACSGPLYLSAVYGHLECFQLLLAHGADPNYNCTDEKMIARIKRPKTLLELCLRHGCGAEFVKLLIDFGANVYLPGIALDKISANSEVVDLLARERALPRPLMSQCRLAIRRYLQLSHRLSAVDQLEIPPVLLNYLKHQS
ncbi:ankyrin repeat and SOCS box protein 12-like isoform X2 [Hemicordylus capensis]|uniref:ankyrin repeat and SOCS box protein 12-like isoform X2 n=1 Tax=Hemicordylus capensis TaxID=884348 RepID=UPI0023043A4D|nr:ankyrin repeat and SOCS box protein 12-like isoform X2 [Hemicordylus capensis]